MDITKETPRSEITVQGVQLQAPEPYSEGHTLAANEAAVLNQTLSENLRNNYARTVKAHLKERGAVDKDGNVDESKIDIKELQKGFDEYVKGYEFGVRRSGGGGAKLSPLEKLTMNLAKQAVRDQIKESDYKVSDFAAAQITELAEQLIEKDPFYKEEAQRQLDAKKKAADAAIDLSGLTKADDKNEAEAA